MRTATQDRELQRLVRWDGAVRWLLERLRPTMRAYSVSCKPLPEHGVDWVVDINDDPGRIILEAMRVMPALWLHALPEGLCIVSKHGLTGLVGNEFADYLESAGSYLLENEAGRRRWELEERERGR